ncbi:unnamed protein product [Hyaloperonospora brassicae]|uniref:Methyltransferase type 11 domain-containing protein n=1 Tax=Hyaloperonospora brassicae TaxID=162125 RepID=A0AAV0TAC8_HYABA|nr:unnamed protein product [Hyaloperonospora brassicae]
MENDYTDAKWSAHATTYSSVFSPMTQYWAADALRIAHRDILEKLDHNAKSGVPFHFLDVGCGPGVLSFEFARRYLHTKTDIRITASDWSDVMLQQVTNALEDDPALRPFRAAITPLQADGTKLESIPTASVDAVGSNFGLSIIIDRTPAWTAARRVLKDDGLFIVTAWADKSSNLIWFDRVTDMCNASESDGEPLNYPSLVAASDRERVLKELQAAGFRQVKSYCTTHTVVFDDLKTLAQANMDNPFGAKFLERLTKEQMEATLMNLMEEDSRKNTYSEEGSAATTTSGDVVADLSPTLIPITAFTIVARK